MTIARPLPAVESPSSPTRGPAVRVLGFLVLVAVLTLSAIASLTLGARPIPPLEVLQILLGDLTGPNAVVVAELRVPRTLIAVIAGVALGVSGGLIQAVTRNPLADPGILGVNSGPARRLPRS